MEKGKELRRGNRLIFMFNPFLIDQSWYCLTLNFQLYILQIEQHDNLIISLSLQKLEILENIDSSPNLI